MDENQNYQSGQNPQEETQQNFNTDNQYQNNPYQDNAYQNNTYQNNQYQPYQQYQGSYQNYQPYPQSQLDLEEPVKLSEWIVTMLIMMVPCVNIVMVFVWAFSQNEKKSKSNFFKASLIMAAVFLVIYIFFAIVLVALLGISYF